MMGELHRALGVSGRGVEEWAKTVAGIPATRSEAGRDELLQRVSGELTERHGGGLCKERVAAVGEGVAHQARVGAREDVCGCCSVLLQLRAERARDPRDPHYLLKLVEGNHALLRVPFVQAQGQRESLQQGGAPCLGRDGDADAAWGAARSEE